MQYELGFIGYGNMGSALAKVALRNVKNVAVCDRNAHKIAAAKALGAVGVSLEEIAQNADFVVLGIKPQGLEETLSPIANLLRAREEVVVVSMLAGVSIAGLRKTVGKDVPVIRIMPNTPVAVGQGVILCSTSGVTEAQKERFCRYFADAGTFDFIPESEIDGGCALSGCGPAFVYAFSEGLIAGGVACGLSQEQAVAYAAQTLRGAAEMLAVYKDPVSLRQAVCSKRGATLAGVDVLEKKEFSQTAKEAVLAAYKRTLELKK